MVVSMVVFAIMISLVLWGHGHSIASDGSVDSTASRATDGARSWWSSVALAGQHGKGASLDAPADPARPYPARHEWYFLFLFQLLKYFPGEREVIGTVVVP